MVPHTLAHPVETTETCHRGEDLLHSGEDFFQRIKALTRYSEAVQQVLVSFRLGSSGHSQHLQNEVPADPGKAAQAVICKALWFFSEYFYINLKKKKKPKTLRLP